MKMTLLVLATLVFVPMLAENALSSRNTRALLAGGAREPTGDVFRIMQGAYPACFVAMIAESLVGRRASPSAFTVGLILFAAAKGLKYWAIATLGPRWSFRVLVPPGSSPITQGPYRVLRHPNYVAVMGELVGISLMCRASIAGPLSALGFGFLIHRRIAVEERALAAADRPAAPPG